MSYFKAKCTKFDFGWGSAPDPAGGAHSAPPDPLAGFEGLLLLREGNGRKGKREGEEKERGKEGKGEDSVMAFGGMDAPEVDHACLCDWLTYLILGFCNTRR